MPGSDGLTPELAQALVGQSPGAGKVLVTRSARSDGTRIYVEMSIAVVLDAGGQVLGILSHVRDITERFEKEKKVSNTLAG